MSQDTTKIEILSSSLHRETVNGETIGPGETGEVASSVAARLMSRGVAKIVETDEESEQADDLAGPGTEPVAEEADDEPAEDGDGT